MILFANVNWFNKRSRQITVKLEKEKWDSGNVFLSAGLREKCANFRVVIVQVLKKSGMKIKLRNCVDKRNLLYCCNVHSSLYFEVSCISSRPMRRLPNGLRFVCEYGSVFDPYTMLGLVTCRSIRCGPYTNPYWHTHLRTFDSLLLERKGKQDTSEIQWTMNSENIHGTWKKASDVFTSNDPSSNTSKLPNLDGGLQLMLIIFNRNHVSNLRNGTGFPI